MSSVKGEQAIKGKGKCNSSTHGAFLRYFGHVMNSWLLRNAAD